MRSLKKITVGVSAQAYLLLAMTAVWYGSVFGWMSEMDNRKIFWTSLFVGLPFVMLLFEIILLVSYWRAGRSHPWLVWPACFGNFHNKTSKMRFTGDVA